MATYSLFPTRVYSARLVRSAALSLNARLLQECRQLAVDDRAGQRWSEGNYPGGYTSYASVNQMQRMSPVFAQLEKRLDRHVHAFAQELQYDLGGRRLAMTDCWVNVMPRGVAHGLHLHPLSVVSGTYYVRMPRGASGLKFEDPRLDRYMGAPPRAPGARMENRQWVTMAATAGQVLLFESWLRHEVPPNPVAGERVSISFNYAWG